MGSDSIFVWFVFPVWGGTNGFSGIGLAIDTLFLDDEGVTVEMMKMV